MMEVHALQISLGLRQQDRRKKRLRRGCDEEGNNKDVYSSAHVTCSELKCELYKSLLIARLGITILLCSVWIDLRRAFASVFYIV